MTIYDLERVPKTWDIRYIPKKSGGKRKLTIPNPELMEVQEDILWALYGLWFERKLQVSSVAHGFLPGRSCLTAVSKHSKTADIIVATDIKSFFDNVKAEQALMCLLDADLSKDLATAMINCCQYEGVMPQGAPTSPFLTNVVMFDADNQIAAYAKKHGFTYTRYADDMAFSLEHAPWKVLRKLRDAEKEEIAYQQQVAETPEGEPLPEKPRSKNPYLWFLFGVEKILKETLGLRLNHEKDHIIFRGSICKPHVLGVCIRQDGVGYNAINKLRRTTRARVFNLHKKVFLQQNGCADDVDKLEWMCIKGSVNYMDYVRSFSEPPYNSIDPKIQSTYYSELERLLDAKSVSQIA